ncbi:MAG: SDR family NAD(P)-dependent oxidoreductase [Planctomycetales bacterium]|nr:SDR family NAD(P)-dependent oxidoreductase [Planctomycetales bacterium]
MPAAVGKNIFITGVSSGLGHALSTHYLAAGASVFGVSRRRPGDLCQHENFHYQTLDLRTIDAIEPTMAQLLAGQQSLDLAILNAGILGTFGDLSAAYLDDLMNTMQVNMWSNKVLLDAIFRQIAGVRQVVAISSGAAVNGNRGWSGYSLSKAALNMLVALYSHEQPKTHFCAFAPGVIDTAMQDYLCGLERGDKFPALSVLRGKRGTSDMPDAATAAPRLATAMARLPALVTSGDYADVRLLDL